MGTRWDGIEEFLAVATHGSFARGADAIGVSRTHMSRAVIELEDRLRVRLLHRTTRTVKLTTAGEEFVENCRRLVADRDAALAQIGETGEPHGDLHVTCSIALGERFVAPIARAAAREFPDLRIHLDLSNRVVDLVAEGFDLAIRTGKLSSSSLIATRLSERRMFTCAAPGYLASHGTPEAIADLDRHACLVGSSTLWHFQKAGGEHLYRPQPRWHCNNGETILAAALEGMGICQLPDFYVRNGLRNGQLVPVLERYAAPNDPIWAVYPDRRHLAPKVRHFVEALRNELPHRLTM
jgi:DNA-binding transcriptional LysR family regulator